MRFPIHLPRPILVSALLLVGAHTPNARIIDGLRDSGVVEGKYDM